MTPREVEQHLDAYNYLVKEVLPHVKNGAATDVLKSKFSHALEFIKNKKIAPLREKASVRKEFAKLLINERSREPRSGSSTKCTATEERQPR